MKSDWLIANHNTRYLPPFSTFAENHSFSSFHYFGIKNYTKSITILSHSIFVHFNSEQTICIRENQSYLSSSIVEAVLGKLNLCNVL